MFKKGQKIKVIGTKEQLRKIDVPASYIGREGVIKQVYSGYFNKDGYYDLSIHFKGESGDWGIMRDLIKVIGEPG